MLTLLLVAAAAFVAGSVAAVGGILLLGRALKQTGPNSRVPRGENVCVVKNGDRLR